MTDQTIAQHLEEARELQRARCWTEAETAYRSVLARQPDCPEAIHGLGWIAYSQGRVEEAVSFVARAIILKPTAINFHRTLGLALEAQGKFEEAVAAFRAGLRLAPRSAELHHGIGTCLREMNRGQAAIAAFELALNFDPSRAETYVELAETRRMMYQFEAALKAIDQAVKLAPALADAYRYRGNIYADMGLIDRALESHRRAVALDPGDALLHSQVICGMLLQPNCDLGAQFAEQTRWWQRHADHLRDRHRPHDNDRAPSRRLRVGYLSPNFKEHPVGRAVLPLLAGHDHSAFEVYGYSDVRKSDDMTARCRAHMDVWREVKGWDGEKLAEQIRTDRIDVLVDLTLHSADQRLLVFARKPAPVQVTFVGYPGGTGLDTIDARLTDRFLDPPGLNDAFYAERSIRLPDSFFCYDSAVPPPPVNDLPALTAGRVTFASLNHPRKINPAVVSLWARVLAAVPGSRLVLRKLAAATPIPASFREAGIEPERLQFAGWVPRSAYHAQYHAYDLALDPFPYPGHTTTCDALLMGVPPVTLVGQTPVARGGLSLLANVGLAELATYSEAEYLRRAVELASDLPRLAALRAGLQDRMQASPLMDGPRYARNVEQAYRDLWCAWCGTGGSPK